jgi:hypothetical protein
VRKFLLTSAMAILGGWVSCASAQGNPASMDSRVEAALRAAKLDFSIDDGDFRLDCSVADGRSQRVWVASNAAKVAQLEVRDVWSVAYRAKGVPPANLANRLLAENVRMALGAWQVNQGPDEYLVVFSSPIAADADAATLNEVIDAIALSTDRMEKQLTGKDEF